MQDDYAILSPPHDRALTPVTQPPLKAIHSSSKRLRKWIKPEVKQSRSGRRQGRDTKTDNFNGETRNKGLVCPLFTTQLYIPTVSITFQLLVLICFWNLLCSFFLLVLINSVLISIIVFSTIKSESIQTKNNYFTI